MEKINEGFDNGIFMKGRVMILFFAVVVAILQGNYVTSVAFGADRQPQMAVVLVIGILAGAFFISRVYRGKLSASSGLLYIIFGGMLMRSAYVLFMDIWTLQNDGGTFTGFGTPDINNGHIGYAEYMYKFFHIPDMDPYEHFGYYHPPLHHIIEAIWLTIQRLIGVPEALAFENLQIPTLIYSGLCMLVMLHILRECKISERLMMAGMLLFAFHPRMMVLGGSVNNDMLALLLLLVTIWRSLVWIRERTYKNIILMALSLGFGMISKLNTAICAFSIAIIFVMYFVEAIKSKNLVEIKNTVLQYVVFGVICVPLGLSYVIRNLVLFSEKPGIPSPALIPTDSVMYTGDYSVWSIIGIPTLADLHISFPFHPLSAKASHNTWVIMFQTGLFAEGYPTTIGDFLLAFAQVAYVSFIILSVLTAVVFIVGYTVRFFKDGREKSVLFLLSTYICMLISFGLFVFKYPYTCSSDFRYMTATLVFLSLGFIMLQKKDGEDVQDISNKNTPGALCAKVARFIANVTMATMLIGSMIVHMNWEI